MAFAVGSPNATLSYRTVSDPRPVNLAMTLQNPKYDGKKKTVTYRVAILTDAPQILESALGKINQGIFRIPKTFLISKKSQEWASGSPYEPDGLHDDRT